MRILLVLGLLLAPVASAAEDAVVRVNDAGAEPSYGFEPARITVPPGGTVLVQGGRQEPHTLTHDAPQGARKFDSGNIDVGQSATLTAPAELGEYPFHCLYHPGMTGTLVVAPGATNASTTTTGTTTSTPPSGSSRTPFALPLVLVALAGASLILRRRP